MKNPAEFWKKHEIASKIKGSFTPIKPYEKDMTEIDGTGELVFDKVAKILCQEHPEDFRVNACIDLDIRYQASKNELIEAVREQTGNKSPFIRRKAYLVKIPLKWDENRKEASISTFGTTKKEDLFRVWGLTCQFENEEWGDWKRYKKVSEIDENGAVDTREEEDLEGGYKYLNTSLFLHTLELDRIAEVISRIKEETNEIFLFVLAPYVKKQIYNGKVSLTLFADDLIFLD